MADKIIHSIVIPILDEEETLNEMYRRLSAVMEGLSGGYEIIFVDDGSKDQSFKILKTLHQRDERLRIIKFTKNFGHHIAITAGIDYAAGETIVLMDGDLQDPPEEIPKLYKKFNEGYNIVHAVRRTRKMTFSKKIFSGLFYIIFNRLTKMDISPHAGIFKMMSREVAEALKACPERSRFIPGLIGWAGFSSASVETEQKMRFAGRPKYSLWRSFVLAVRSVVSFSRMPFATANLDAETQERPLYAVEEKIGFDGREPLKDERDTAARFGQPVIRL